MPGMRWRGFQGTLRFKAALTFGRTEVNILTRRPIANVDALGMPPILSRLPLGGGNSVSKNRLDDTLAKLRQLTSEPQVGRIARTRLGILHYELRQFKDSRRELGIVLKESRDTFLSYLSHLVIGLGFDSEGQPDDARRSFEAAVALDPEVVSGVLQLASHQFALGSRKQATALMDRALARMPAREDPWQRPCPDCGGWSGRLDELHAAVRR